MKNFTIITILFLCTTLANNALAMGFPHNLLAGKRGLRKDKISNHVQNNIPKKIIMLKSERLNHVGQKVLSYIFSQKI
ncbi:MAG: hypothetical protein V4585_19940 [Bacteroidota bacterium]|jgi:hypothetical protein